MSKERESQKVSERKGGLCCDHCSDSKYPCVHMENKMKRDSRGKAEEEQGKAED